MTGSSHPTAGTVLYSILYVAGTAIASEIIVKVSLAQLGPNYLNTIKSWSGVGASAASNLLEVVVMNDGVLMNYYMLPIGINPFLPLTVHCSV